MPSPNLIKPALVATVVLALSNASAFAQARQSCTLMVTEDGRLIPNAANTALSSKNPGGRSGNVTVSATNSRYSVYLDTPFGFAEAPAGGNNDVEFQVTYSGRGKTQFLEKPANIPTRIKRGDSFLTIDITAQRLNGSFPSGNYRTGVTVRCE